MTSTHDIIHQNHCANKLYDLLSNFHRDLLDLLESSQTQSIHL